MNKEQLADNTKLVLYLMEIPSNKGRNANIFIETVNALSKIAGSLHRLDEAACNRPVSAAEETRGERLWVLAQEHAALVNVKLVRNTDPRGWSLLVELPSGESNDFGGRGWGVHWP